MFLFIPTVFNRTEVKSLCTLALQGWRTMSLQTSICAQRHCHPGTVLGLLVSVKRNLTPTACKDILRDCASNFMATVCKGTTYTFEDQVSTYIWPDDVASVR